MSRGLRRVAAAALAGGLVLAGITVVASPAAASAPGADVAPAGVVTASSTFPDPALFAASHANDGNSGTRWGSDYTHGPVSGYPASSHDPKNDWVQVALAQPTFVHHVVLDWQAAYGRKFEIQVSRDGVSWTTMRYESNGREGRMRFDLDMSYSVNFVRMQGREASSWGYSLWSFEVWNGSDPSDAWIDPDPTGWVNGVDIAPLGVATASSSYSTAFRAALVNDRSQSPQSRWGSRYGNGFDPKNEWIQIQLAQPSPVWSVKLNWETARPSRFLLQTSQDGSTWTTVRTVDIPAIGWSEYRLGLSSPVKYVRMQGVTPETGWGYSLFDFEVWSGPQSAPPAGGRVVPAPASLTPSGGQPYRMTASTRIVAPTTLADEANLLAGSLRTASGFAIPVVANATPGSADIVLSTSASGAAESYQLTAGSSGVQIVGSDAAGVFYGGQTLLQLLPAAISARTVQTNDWAVAPVTVQDQPRYPYRGMMLDPARNFITVEGVKQTIDMLAGLKANRLHMHLSDDQGWRIEITGWPLLTQIGGARSMPNGVSGFYTQAQFADIVAYANARHIEVIPEIDVPGHSGAAIASYPNLACGRPTTLCTTSATVDGFLEDVFEQVTALSNSDLLHIGGDESIQGQEYITFIKKIEGIVLGLDKRMIGWTPLPMAGLDPSSVHQYWRDQSYEQQPSWWSNDNEVILSPTTDAYLDYPHDWNGGYPPHNTFNTHDWDPTEVRDDYLHVTLQSLGLRNQNVIGIEGPAWGEAFTGGYRDMQYMAFPRIAALMDLAWSPQSATTDTRGFMDRVSHLGARWQLGGMNFWADPMVGWKDVVTGSQIAVTGSARTVNGTVGVVASPTRPAGTLTARVAWGDGSSSAATLSGTAATSKRVSGLLSVQASHTYAAAGTYDGTITITAADGTVLTAPLRVIVN